MSLSERPFLLSFMLIYKLIIIPPPKSHPQDIISLLWYFCSSWSWVWDDSALLHKWSGVSTGCPQMRYKPTHSTSALETAWWSLGWGCACVLYQHSVCLCHKTGQGTVTTHWHLSPSWVTGILILQPRGSNLWLDKILSNTLTNMIAEKKQVISDPQAKMTKFSGMVRGPRTSYSSAPQPPTAFSHAALWDPGTHASITMQILGSLPISEILVTVSPSKLQKRDCWGVLISAFNQRPHSGWKKKVLIDDLGESFFDWNVKAEPQTWRPSFVNI